MSSISVKSAPSSPCRCNDPRVTSTGRPGPTLPSNAFSAATTVCRSTSALPLTTSDMPRACHSSAAMASRRSAAIPATASVVTPASVGAPAPAMLVWRATRAYSAAATAPSADGGTAKR